MARIHLPDLLDLDNLSTPQEFRLLARQSTSGHRIVDDPADADVVLFTEMHQLGRDPLSRLRSDPAFRDFRTRSYVYDERDRPTFSLPGLYVSVERRSQHRSMQRSWSYVHVDDRGASQRDARYLYSFVGSPTHSCRDRVMELEHPDGLVERVDNFVFWHNATELDAQRRQRFNEVLDQSSFVLCPRGHGSASIRLFETMAAGRVPVIISDEWVAPVGPTWEDFAVRWPEARVDQSLVEHLESISSQAASMGALARTAFERHFSQRAFFDSAVDQILAMHQTRPRPARVAIANYDREFMRAAARRARNRVAPAKVD